MLVRLAYAAWLVVLLLFSLFTEGGSPEVPTRVFCYYADRAVKKHALSHNTYRYCCALKLVSLFDFLQDML